MIIQNASAKIYKCKFFHHTVWQFSKLSNLKSRFDHKNYSLWLLIYSHICYLILENIKQLNTERWGNLINIIILSWKWIHENAQGWSSILGLLMYINLQRFFYVQFLTLLFSVTETSLKVEDKFLVGTIWNMRYMW